MQPWDLGCGWATSITAATRNNHNKNKISNSQPHQISGIQQRRMIFRRREKKSLVVVNFHFFERCCECIFANLNMVGTCVCWTFYFLTPCFGVHLECHTLSMDQNTTTIKNVHAQQYACSVPPSFSSISPSAFELQHQPWLSQSVPWLSVCAWCSWRRNSTSS